MDKAEIVRQIETLGLVPVVRASSADEAMQAIDAIKAGGVNVLEITMTVPGAVRVIEKVADKYGSDVLVGAGTVLDPETARACLLAGAQFIVSPALNLATIELCHRYSAPIAPGVLTPTEAFDALDAGAAGLKFFPASLLGPGGLSALMAVLPKGTVVGAVGGVGPDNMADYVRAGVRTFGLGTAVYRPGDSAAAVREKARGLIAAYDSAIGA